jgi:predicted ATPase/class 3 adenylate cyclase
VAPKVAGSSPVAHPLMHVGTQRTSVFCERCEKASPSTWANRGSKEASAAIVSSRKGSKEDIKVVASPPTGTVTFLFTDIEGSTKLWERDAPAMQEALARHDELLRTAIEARGGYVFKTVGDAFCAAFSTPTDALEAALASQSALLAEEWGEIGVLQVCMALHTGAFEERGGDYFGPPVNRVSRLLSAGHGGQVLLSLATQELVRDGLPDGADLNDLGERRLKDLFRPEHVFQLRAHELPQVFPPLRTLDNRRNNLPAQPTPLIGREREVKEVCERLRREEVRLLTLTGPGGTGKTRIGLQAAADLLEDFEDGVFFVELAAIADPALYFSEVGGALGVRESGETPLSDLLKEYLSRRELLLLLDNFEQLLEAAPLVREILSAAARVKVLATSRIPLGLYGEHEYAVGPLSVPDPRRLPPVEALSQYEAVRLFIERAGAAKAGFAVTNENAPAIAAICARLDGLPLAIELAAARTKLLPPKALLTRLGNRLKLLTGGAKDLPARQRTLRGAIEWSHDLLDEGEKTLFRRLAVFSGGRTLEAVDAICDAEGDLPVDALEGVSSLVDNSLLRREEGPEDEPRFVMLETIHEYAREKLQESGEAEVIKGTHAEYFLPLAEEAELELEGSDQLEWLDRLEAEHDNLRAALSWCLAAGEAEFGVRLAGALWWFWFARGHMSEGRRWLDNALAGNSDMAASVRAKGLIGAGRLAAEQGDQREAEVVLEESVRLLRDSADERGLARALHNLGYALLVQGNSERADALQKESLSLFRKAHDGWGVAETLNNLGIVAEHEDDAERAKLLYEESLLLRRELGDKRGIGALLNNLGGLTLVQGNFERAASLLEEGVMLGRELGDKWLLAVSISTVGTVEMLRENPRYARTLLEESLNLAEELGDKSLTVQNLLELAGAAGARGQALRAARLFGATDESCQALAAYFVPFERERQNSLRAAARAELSEGAWEEAWAQGRAMTMDDAVSYALQDDHD